METSLVHPEIMEKWNNAFDPATDKRYPSIDLVRLERWFFNHKPGQLLDFGCGSGLNAIHMLETGYDVTCVDASINAVNRVNEKLSKRSDIGDRGRAIHLPLGSEKLPFADASFDYITCISVISLLASKDRVQRVLKEFVRVMKPGAKLIVDINAPNSDFARGMRHLGDDVYAFEDDGDDAVPTYCPNEASFHELIGEQFSIDDTGHASHNYCGSEVTEYIVCAHKA
jgi:SAM-dependent methyltransferase